MMERGKPSSECCEQQQQQQDQGAGEGQTTDFCVEILTNDLTKYDSLNILHNYETDYIHKDTSDMVLEVDHQIKEKLTVGGTTKSTTINGCLVNGMTKLDEERIKTIFHCSPMVKELEEDDDEGIENSPSQETVDTLTTEEEENCDSGVKCLSSSHSSSNSQSTTSSALCSSDGVGPTLQCDEPTDSSISYIGYESELQMPDIMRLIQKDLSEPYSIYTYRYFIHNWPKLCFLAMDSDKCVGAVVCKLDLHKKIVRRGYIAMLAVDENYRKRKIGSNLVLKAIRAMVADDADEVVLETEITNKPALRLYENLGFVRDKRLFRYYLNGVDALRLKLWLR